MVIRDIQGAEELRACQALQRKTWGITEDGYVVPVATMAAAQKVGGLVLGAFDSEGQLRGFTFAFLGRLRGCSVLYSQLAAVDPSFQGGGIGRQLKFEQRRRAAEMGLDAVAWAFDPLQAANAAFNLAVLGARARTYEVNLYGVRSDALNPGLPTDRLLAEWPTHGEVHGQGDAWPEAPDLIDSAAPGAGAVGPPGEGAGGVREPRLLPEAVWRGASRVRIEIPPALATAAALGDLPRRWQAAVRAAFQTAFARGYVAVGFSRADPLRPRYLLEASPTP